MIQAWRSGEVLADAVVEGEKGAHRAPRPNYRVACRSQIAANFRPRSSPYNSERLPLEHQTFSRSSSRRCRIRRATCCRANFSLISVSFILSFLALTGVFTAPSDGENQSRWRPRMEWPGSTLTDSRSRYHGKNEREGRAEPGQALRLMNGAGATRGMVARWPGVFA